jgi:hypothetical protein
MKALQHFGHTILQPIQRTPMRVNLRALAGPDREGARPRAPQRRAKLTDVFGSLDRDKHARLREQSRGRGTGTRSLPALGPPATRRTPDRLLVV